MSSLNWVSIYFLGVKIRLFYAYVFVSCNIEHYNNDILYIRLLGKGVEDMKNINKGIDRTEHARQRIVRSDV